jgi:hypothetical protein
MRPAGKLVLGGMLAASSLSACGSSVAAVNTGPFGNGGSPGGNCIDIHRGEVLSYGFTEFRNSDPSTAVIEKVALADPHGLQILAAYEVPITGHNLYGVLTGFPPAVHVPPGVQWSRRRPADGAAIPHSPGSNVTNLVLVLKPVKRSGSAMGVDIYYRVSERQYHLRTATQILVLVGQTCPNTLP